MIAPFDIFPPGEPPLRYRVEKRWDNVNLHGRKADFRGPHHLNPISQGGGGGLTGKKKLNRAIIAKAFSYLHNEFEALWSKRLPGKFAKN